MDHFCANHPAEKAVVVCGRCGSPACYRCSMTVGQVVYCSLKCFTELDSPSSQVMQARWALGNDPLAGVDLSPSSTTIARTRSSTGSPGPDPLADLYAPPGSADRPAPPPQAPGHEPSVILSAHQADEPPSESSITMKAFQADRDNSNTTILGMSPIPKSGETAKSLSDETVSAEKSLADETVSAAFDSEAGVQVRAQARDSALDGVMPILIPGTRRSIISSSCFFHPDTSAIVLCVDCRNPICSLCAEETARGLVCSPSCGVPDPVRVQENRTLKAFSLVLAAAFVAVVAGGAFLFSTYRQEQQKLAQAPLHPRTPPAPLAPDSIPPALEPVSLPIAAPLPARDPDPIVNPFKPEPLKGEVSKLESPKPEISKPDPAPVVKPKADVPPEAPPVELTQPEPPAPKPARPDPAPTVKAKADVLPLAPKVELPKLEPPAEVAKGVAPRPEPAPVKPTAFQLDLQTAASLLRRAEPVFRELADTMDPKLLRKADILALGERLDALSLNLNEAKRLYAGRVTEAPDPAALEKRIDVLGELLEAVDDGQRRIRVPRTILEADRLNQNASRSTHEIILGLKSPRPDEAALRRNAELTDANLREALALYHQVKSNAPDPKAIRLRILSVESLLQTLESHFPGLRTPEK